MAILASKLRSRPMHAADVPQVLELINADRVTGQPLVTEAMLDDAKHGRSAVDAGWWAALADLRVDVLVDGHDRPAGVISYASRPRDGVGVILWLHGRETTGIVAALLDHALGPLHDRPRVEAFAFASALTVGQEALPVRHRPATAHALRARGFIGTDLWRYMHRQLPAPELHSWPLLMNCSD